MSPTGIGRNAASEPLRAHRCATGCANDCETGGNALPCLKLERMGRDSNPRDAYAPAGFQDRCLQPLGHPSDLGNSTLSRRGAGVQTVSCPRVCPQGGLFIPPSHYPKLLRSHPCLVLGAAIGDRHALELLGARFVTDTGTPTPTDTGSGSLCRPIPSAAVRPLMVRQLPPLLDGEAAPLREPPVRRSRSHSHRDD